jgi:hypothetical protein
MNLKEVIAFGNVYGYSFKCPGCGFTHILPVSGSTKWEFNGNMSSPTFSPSLLNYEVLKPDGTIYASRCHLTITNGEIFFHSDSKHKMAGKSVLLSDI